MVVFIGIFSDLSVNRFHDSSRFSTSENMALSVMVYLGGSKIRWSSRFTKNFRYLKWRKLPGHLKFLAILGVFGFSRIHKDPGSIQLLLVISTSISGTWDAVVTGWLLSEWRTVYLPIHGFRWIFYGKWLDDWYVYLHVFPTYQEGQILWWNLPFVPWILLDIKLPWYKIWYL